MATAFLEIMTRRRQVKVGLHLVDGTGINLLPDMMVDHDSRKAAKGGMAVSKAAGKNWDPLEPSTHLFLIRKRRAYKSLQATERLRPRTYF